MSTLRTATMVLALAFSSGLACTPPMSTDMAIAELRNPNPKLRAGAADRLRRDEGVPPEAIQPLIDASKTEQDPAAKGAMMITLGRSGKPEVKDLVEQYVQNAHGPDERRWAARALKYWLIQNGALAPNESLPEGWPYGTKGYPPIEKE
jgi:hypothetical protein